MTPTRKKALPRYDIPVGGGVISASVEVDRFDGDHLTVWVGGCGSGRLPLGTSVAEQAKVLHETVRNHLARRANDLREKMREYEAALGAWESGAERFITESLPSRPQSRGKR